MANFRPNMNITPRTDTLYPCACSDTNGNVSWFGYTNTAAECTNKCKKSTITASGGNVDGMRKATGTSFQRPRKGGTGQHVAGWNNASGTILGYTPMQVIIAVGVGVGAYFLYKKYK
jgi:hypothetical protein